MKLHSFHELATRIAHLSTRDGKGVTITFGGKDAYTNGKHINLPALPSGTTLTPSQYSIWLGYCLHEGPGHLGHTDFKVYEQANLNRPRDPVFSSVLNILEDVRIENADISLYPGDRRHLDNTHHYVDSLIPPEKLQSPDQITLLYKAAFKYRNYDLPVPGETTPEIADALKGLPECKSTSDIVRLATQITSLLKSPPKEPDNGQQQNQEVNPDGTDGENRNPNEDSSSNRHPDGNSNNPGNGGQEDNNNSNGGNEYSSLQRTPQSNPFPSHDLARSAEEWQELTEIGNILESLIERAKDKIPPIPSSPGEFYFPPADLSLDKIFVPGQEDLSSYLRTRAQLNSQILALKKMFRIYLQSQSQKSWLRGQEEGEALDKERLHNVALGDTSVFKSRRNRQLINTAVELMLDLSTSMDQELVRSSAIILSEALSAIPEIKLSICGFTTNGTRAYRDHYNHTTDIGRTEGMNILVFKDYTDPYIKCRAKLGAIHTRGHTPLGDAYGKALEHILPRPEPRKVLFLVTDGRPEFNVCDPRHSDFPLMAQVHKKAQKLGIETLGLGIGHYVSDFLPQYVDKCVNIEEIENLPQALLQILKGIVK